MAGDEHRTPKTTEPPLSQGFLGSEGGGDRTHDPQIKSLLLYRLSYASDTIILRRGPGRVTPGTG